MTRNANLSDGLNVSEAPTDFKRPKNPPPAPPSVTHNGRPPKAKTPAQRQKTRRDKLAASGIKEVTAELDASTFAELENSRKVRGGTSGPYSAKDYLAALVREDAARLRGQIADAQRYPCRQCGKTLPEGCGGAFKGELACLHTPTAWKLQIPTVEA